MHGVDTLRGRLGEKDDLTGSRAGFMAQASDAAPFHLRNRISSPVREREEQLIRRLAADHLRELRDDGVTLDYVARMYGVTPERLEILYRDLIPGPPG